METTPILQDHANHRHDWPECPQDYGWLEWQKKNAETCTQCAEAVEAARFDLPVPAPCRVMTEVHGPHEYDSENIMDPHDKKRVLSPGQHCACPGVTEDQKRVVLRFINEQGLSMGRIVHYVISRKDNEAESISRPAIVINAWSATSANLQVFYDGTNDNRERGVTYGNDDFRAHMGWATSACFDSGEYRKAPFVYHGTMRIKESDVENYSKQTEVTYKHVMHYNSGTFHWPPRT